MSLAVRSGDQTTATVEHARDLAQRAVEVCGVEEHPGCDDEIEGSVLEWKILDIAGGCVDTPTPCQPDHARRHVRRYDVRAKLSRHALGERSWAWTDFENPPRHRLRDTVPQDVERAGPLARLVDRAPTEQTRLSC